MPASNPYKDLIPVVSRKGKVEALVLVKKRPQRAPLRKDASTALYMQRLHANSGVADTDYKFDKYGFTASDWAELGL